MKIETLTHDKFPGIITIITMAAGERHSLLEGNYISRDAGIVIIVENETSGIDWREYNLDCEEAALRIRGIKKHGWREHDNEKSV